MPHHRLLTMVAVSLLTACGDDRLSPIDEDAPPSERLARTRAPVPITLDGDEPPPTLSGLLASGLKYCTGGGTTTYDLVYVTGTGFPTELSRIDVRWAGCDFTPLASDGVTITARPCAEAFAIEGAHPVEVTLVTASGTHALATSEALSMTRDTALGCASTAGAGLRGTVFKLRKSTGRLPDLGGLGCADPAIDPSAPCPYATIVVPNLDVPQRQFTQGFPGVDGALDEWFAIRFEGRFVAARAGEHEVALNSDDGAKLWMAPSLDPAQTRNLRPVIDNDGVHPPSKKRGEAELALGENDVIVDWFQGPRLYLALQLFERTAGADVIVPASQLRLPLP